MATITPIQITGTATGADLTMAAASGGGDSIANAAHATLLVNNGSGGSITVTFTGVVACSEGSNHDVVVPVAAGKLRPIPVPPQAVNPTTGAAAVAWSSATSVTVAATA